MQDESRNRSARATDFSLSQRARCKPRDMIMRPTYLFGPVVVCRADHCICIRHLLTAAKAASAAASLVWSTGQSIGHWARRFYAADSLDHFPRSTAASARPTISLLPSSGPFMLPFIAQPNQAYTTIGQTRWVKYRSLSQLKHTWAAWFKRGEWSGRARLVVNRMLDAKEFPPELVD